MNKSGLRDEMWYLPQIMWTNYRQIPLMRPPMVVEILIVLEGMVALEKFGRGGVCLYYIYSWIDIYNAFNR